MNETKRMNAIRSLKGATRGLSLSISQITRQVYFDSIPIGQITEAVEAHGFDPSGLHGIYCGDEGRVHADIGFGRGLLVTWYRMASGRFEVVAYVS